MYKLLLLDIDGTLRDEYSGIPDSTCIAIDACRTKECRVVICSGRSKGTIQEDVMQLSIDGYIMGGGSHIEYHDEVLCDESLPDDMIQNVAALLQKKQVAFAIESNDKVFMNQGAKEIFDYMNQKKQKHKNINKQFIQEKIQYVNNIAEYKHQPIHKLCLWSTADVFREVSERLQGYMEVAQQDIYEDMQYYEIIQSGFHKGNAITHLQNKLGITKAKTICFGDGENDVEMFKVCGCAIAMKDSHERLKLHATSICEGVEEDGIYLELKRREII